MPLIDCPDCTNPVSDRAAFCPTCGCPSKYFPNPEPPKAPAGPPPPLKPILEPFQLLGRLVLALTVAVVVIDLVGLGMGDLHFRWRGLTLVGSAQILVYSLLHYRWWASLPEGSRRTTPELGVAGCLIPLFNVPWLRTTWLGLVEDLNKFLVSRKTPAHSASTMLTQGHVGLYYLGAPILAALPWLGFGFPLWLHVLVDLAAVTTLGAFIGEVNKAAGYVRAHLRRG